MPPRRHALSDEQFERIAPFLPGQKHHRGVTASDNRLFVDAVLFWAKTGIPWRDLPERYGRWNSVFRRFKRWCEAGVWARILDELADPELTEVFVDSTIVRVHQNASQKTNRTERSVGVAEE